VGSKVHPDIRCIAAKSCVLYASCMFPEAIDEPAAVEPVTPWLKATNWRTERSVA
jgi:hypothetical protein